MWTHLFVVMAFKVCFKFVFWWNLLAVSNRILFFGSLKVLYIMSRSWTRAFFSWTSSIFWWSQRNFESDVNSQKGHQKIGRNLKNFWWPFCEFAFDFLTSHAVHDWRSPDIFLDFASDLKKRAIHDRDITNSTLSANTKIVKKMGLVPWEWNDKKRMFFCIFKKKNQPTCNTIAIDRAAKPRVKILVCSFGNLSILLLICKCLYVYVYSVMKLVCHSQNLVIRFFRCFRFSTKQVSFKGLQPLFKFFGFYFHQQYFSGFKMGVGKVCWV